MRAVLLNYSEKLRSIIAKSILVLVGVWVLFALCFQIFFVILHFSGNEELATKIANQITWKIDGTFKNSPGNIWYNANDHIYVEKVSNKIQIGNLAGNRNLEFGVKNVMNEFLQEKGLDISEDAQNKIQVDIVYLDVLKTQSSFSIVHNNSEAVVIRLQGRYYKDGKLQKTVLVQESAEETSMSTLIIDEGGKFNQQNLSTALKKACNSLVNKLL